MRSRLDVVPDTTRGLPNPLPVRCDGCRKLVPEDHIAWASCEDATLCFPCVAALVSPHPPTDAENRKHD